VNTLVIALSALLGQADGSSSLQWQQDYAQAQKMAAQGNKSLAVFLTQGQNGMNMLVSGGLNQRAQEILANNYIPVMVDTATPQGQRLARAFEIRDGRGLVLSDRGGMHQALWYQGNLTNQDLVSNLEKFANQTNVRMTETAGRVSSYPPGEEPAQTGRRTGVPRNQVSTTSESPRRQRTLFQGRLNRRTTTAQ